MKKLLFIAIVALALSSCASLDIRHRVYGDGFYVHKKGSASVVVRQDTPPAMTEEKKIEPLKSILDNKINEALAAPRQMEPVRREQQRPGAERHDVKEETRVAPPGAKVATGDGIHMRRSTMLTLGWVFASLAIISLFVLWPLIFCLVPAVILLVMGYSKPGPAEERSDSGEMVDVVYLKNGSIIKGVIIEQVPNESIKIKTRDGSVFFYKMEEVQKITKETP